MRRVLAIAAAGGLVLAACGSDAPDSGLTPATVSSTSTVATTAPSTSTTSADGSTTSIDETAPTTPTTSAPASSRRPLAQIDLGLDEVGSFAAPVAAQVRPETTDLYVAEKSGRVRRARDRQVVLDLSSKISTGAEQGLLGLTFDAEGDRLFVSYTDTSGTSQVVEYQLGTDTADEPRVLLSLKQPFANHNGGDIHLGPDGFLWIAYGDGGSGGDPQNNGQNPATLLGSILRIDPDAGTDSRPYGIPGDNPFATGAGGAPEVWLYGVRNPWRISFDAATGDLWVADVGQNQWEEVSVLRTPKLGRGANLGWNSVEGTHSYDGGIAPAGSTPPIYEYNHDGGNCSITGGVVARGASTPQLDGAYFFADYCVPGLRAIRSDGAVATELQSWDVATGNITSFALDANGDVLVLSQQGPIYRIVVR